MTKHVNPHRPPGYQQCCAEVQYENTTLDGPSRDIHYCLKPMRHDGPHLISRPDLEEDEA